MADAAKARQRGKKNQEMTIEAGCAIAAECLPDLDGKQRKKLVRAALKQHNTSDGVMNYILEHRDEYAGNADEDHEDSDDEDEEEDEEEEDPDVEEEFEPDEEVNIQIKCNTDLDPDTWVDVTIFKSMKHEAMDKVLKKIKDKFPYFEDVSIEELGLFVAVDGYSGKRIALTQHCRPNMKVTLKNLNDEDTSGRKRVTRGNGSVVNGGSGEKKDRGDNSSNDRLKQSDIRDYSSSSSSSSSSSVINLTEEDADEEIDVIVFTEEDKDFKVPVRFSKKLSLFRIKSICIDALNKNTLNGCQLELVVTDGDPVVLQDGKLLENGSQVLLTNLEYLIFEDHKGELIEKKLFSAKNLQTFDQTTIELFSRVFKFYRRVGGDGNCFYRALYLGIIEKFLGDICTHWDSEDKWDEEAEEAARKRLSAYFAMLKSTRRMDAPEDQRKLQYVEDELLTSCTKYIEEESKKDKPSQMLRFLVLQDKASDMVLVRAQRCIVAQYLEDASAHDAALTLADDGGVARENANVSKMDTDEAEPAEANVNQPSLSISEVIMINFDGLTVEQFINDIVLKLGRDAEDVIVIFASRAFQARVCVWQVDVKAAERMIILAGEEVGPPDEGSTFYGEVHLLLRGAHYDLLYPDPDLLPEDDRKSSVPKICEALRKPSDPYAQQNNMNVDAESQQQQGEKRKRPTAPSSRHNNDPPAAAVDASSPPTLSNSGSANMQKKKSKANSDGNSGGSSQIVDLVNEGPSNAKAAAPKSRKVYTKTQPEQQQLQQLPFVNTGGSRQKQAEAGRDTDAILSTTNEFNSEVAEMISEYSGDTENCDALKALQKVVYAHMTNFDKSSGRDADTFLNLASRDDKRSIEVQGLHQCDAFKRLTGLFEDMQKERKNNNSSSSSKGVSPSALFTALLEKLDNALRAALVTDGMGYFDKFINK